MLLTPLPSVTNCHTSYPPPPRACRTLWTAPIEKSAILRTSARSFMDGPILRSFMPPRSCHLGPCYTSRQTSRYHRFMRRHFIHFTSSIYDVQKIRFLTIPSPCPRPHAVDMKIHIALLKWLVQ